MAFFLSPQVAVIEKDLSTTIPAVATSITGYVGKFSWGPVNERTLITNERDLVDFFGYPSNDNFEHFFTGWNYLQYASSLWVVRAATHSAGTATLSNSNVVITDAGVTSSLAQIYIPNNTYFESQELVNDYPGVSEFLTIAAKYPGSEGNDIKVSVANSSYFSSTLFGTSTNVFAGAFQAVDLEDDEIAIAVFKKKRGVSHSQSIDNYDLLESFIVSTNENSLSLDGSSNYIETVINRGSKYIYAMHNASVTMPATLHLYGFTLSNGASGSYSNSAIMEGYDLFSNPEDFDVNIVLDGGNNNVTIQQYINDNITTSRKDCIAIFNALRDDIIGVPQGSTIVSNLVSNVVDELSRGTSSYAAFYGNYKYQYDKYNDVYRWVPLSGDMAGIYAQTDYLRDPWFAPAGFNRGAVKNVTKLAFTPNLAQRDQLYKNNINPVVMFPGEGPIVFGQKTLQIKPSAFDRVDVRRLFIFLEKAISTAAKYFLFEKNTDFTRRLLKGIIEPFLREVKGREGIYDFRVVCDETNNTGEVIDRNELVCDIYLKPTKSVEFLVLNFIATKTGVNFDEIIRRAA